MPGKIPFAETTAMFALTDSAREELDAFFTDKDKSPIRVYLASGGCGGPRLALALDDPTDQDKVFDDNGYSFCVNSELFDAARKITVDFSDLGFAVQSELQLDSGCAPSCCSSCGGGCAE
jgi:Fe-S cluster assembly iron-binding protein IscA